MAARDTYKIDGPSARRLDRVARKVLSGRDTTSDAGERPRKLPETIFARLLDTTADDGFTFQEVYRKADGEWEVLPNGRTSGPEDEWPAYDLVAGTSTVSDDPVILKRAAITDGDDTTPAWIIFAAGGGSVKWGKIASYTAGSNTVILTPCNAAGTATGEANVAVAITLPTGRTNCSFFAGAVGNVLPYFDQDNVKWLASIPMPYSTTKYDVFSIAATTGQGGFDSVRIK